MAQNRNRNGSLIKQKVAVTFEGGLDQVTAADLVTPGKMTRMENGVYNKVGEVSKRNGYDDTNVDVDVNYPAGVTAPYSGPSVLTGESAGVLDDELLLFDGNRVFSRSVQDANWTFVDQATPVVTRSERVLWGSSSPGSTGTSSFERLVSDQHAYQCLYHNGLYIYTWQDSDPTVGPSALYYSIVDSTTGDHIVNSQKLTAGFYSTRLVFSGQYIFLVGSESSFNTNPQQISLWRLDTASWNARAPWVDLSATLAVNDAHATQPLMDAIEIDATEIGISYVRTFNQANQIRTMRVDFDGNLIASLVTAEECDRCLSMYREPNTGDLGIAWVDTHTQVGNTVTEDVKLLVWDAALTPGGPWPVYQAGPLGMLINRETGVDVAGTARHISLGPGCTSAYYSVIWDTALGVTNPGWNYAGGAGAALRLVRYAAYDSKVVIRQCSSTIVTNQADYDINGIANGIVGQTALAAPGGNDGFNPNIYYASLASRQFDRGDGVFFSVVQPTQAAQPIQPDKTFPYAVEGFNQIASATSFNYYDPEGFWGSEYLKPGVTILAGDNGTGIGVHFANNGVIYQEFTVTSVDRDLRIAYGTINFGTTISWDAAGGYEFLYIKQSIPSADLPANPLTPTTTTISYPDGAVVPTVQNPLDEYGVQSSTYGLMRMSQVSDVTALNALTKYSGFGTCSVVGKMSENIAGGVHTQGAVSRISEVGAGSEKWIFAGGEVAVIRSDQTQEIRNIRMVAECLVDMGDLQNRYESIEKNKTRLTCGGELSVYDGEQFTAPGWIFPPQVYPDSFSVVFGNTPLVAPLVYGTTGIRAVYEWYDNTGQRHQSAPSSELPVRMSYQPALRGFNQKFNTAITLDVGIYGWLPKDTRVVLYQTLLGQQGLGPYYRVTDVKAFPSQTVTDASGGVQSGHVSISSFLEPEGLADNEILYTNGDVLVNDDAPPSTCIEDFDDRVWLGGLEKPNEVAFSKVVYPGEGISFNSSLRVSVGSETERVVALKAMDNKLVVLKESSIYIIYGDGPNDLGQGATYRAQLVTSDQGCTGPKSVVLTPKGVLFNTSAGIYRLNRGLQLDFVGARVEDSTSGVFFHGADLVPEKTQARFMLSNGSAVVYDYLVDAWYTFTNHTSAGGGSCVMWRGNFSFLNSGGAMKVQNAGFLDDAAAGTGTYITTTLETAWIKAGDVEGLQRVYKGLVLGDAATDHTMVINVGFDYDSAYTDTKTWTAADIAALPRYQLEIRPSRQRCQAIRFKMQDSGVPPTQSKGYVMTYLMLEVGIQSGLYRRYPIAEARK